MLDVKKLISALAPLVWIASSGCGGTDGDLLETSSSSSGAGAHAGAAGPTGSGGSGGTTSGPENGGSGGGTAGSGGGGAGGCGDTQSDPSNCGSCGHDCLGGACMAGACQPKRLADVGSAWDLAIDADRVYFNAGADIDSVKKDGSGLMTISTGPDGACSYGVAVDATDVYWADLCYCAIKKAHKDGTGPATIANVSCPESIALDDSFVYWVNVSGNIQRVSKGGGTIELVASTAQNGNHSGIVVAGADVYWTSPQIGTVSHAPKIGGGPVVDLATGQAQPTGLALDASNAYWLTFTDGGVHQSPLAGPESPAIATGETDGMKIAVDGANVFWTTYDASGALRASHGAAPHTLANLPNAVGIAVDASAAYFTSASDGKVYKLAR